MEVFMKKNCKKLVKELFRIEKVIKRNGDKLYVKWKGYDNSFNGSIDKKDLEWNSLVQKWVNTFLTRLEILEEMLMLKLICPIMQQKLI